MNKVTYDRFRLLQFIQKRGQITRGNLTREGLGRLRCNMADLNSYVEWGLVNNYIDVHTEHIPGKAGKPPEVFTLTKWGKQWLKDEQKRAKRELEGLK